MIKSGLSRKEIKKIYSIISVNFQLFKCKSYDIYLLRRKPIIITHGSVYNKSLRQTTMIHLLYGPLMKVNDGINR